MKRLTRNGVIAVAAASGAMAVTVPAYAGSGADGSTAGSPEPVPHTFPHTVPHVTGALAHTGTDHTLQAIAASAALVAGGVVLCRRFRPGAAG